MANTRTGPDFLDKISDNTHRTDGKKKSFIKQVDSPKIIDMRKKTLMLLAKKKKK